MGMGIQDGGSQSTGGLGFQWLNWAAFPLPCMCPPSVQQLDPVHSGHLLFDIANSYSYCQETGRGFIGIEPVPRACLVLDNWHCRLCLCSPYCSCQSTSCSGSSPHPSKQHNNHNSSQQHNARSLWAFTTVIDGGACGLVLTANSVMFLTILGFFIAFDSE